MKYTSGHISQCIYTVLLLLTSSIYATCVDREAALTHVSNVNDLSILNDGNVELEIPSTSRYHNIKRRWYAISDPNAAIDTFLEPSEDLFRYLARNVSSQDLELPDDVTKFKFIMKPTEQFQEIKITTNDENGNIVDLPEPREQDSTKAYEGTAYRRVSFLGPRGEVQSKYKPVGWARLTVSNNGRTVQGTWKVDDQEGMGVKPCVYHVSPKDRVKPMLGDQFPEEQNIVSSVESSHVVWRDFDMRQHGIHDDDHHDFQAPSIDLVGEKSIKPTINPKELYWRRLKLGKRSSTSGSDNDSGGNFNSGVDLRNSIGDTKGCPSPKKVSLIGIAADCNFISQFPNTSAVSAHIISVANSASRAFENGFNITLGLKEIHIVNTTTCPPMDQASPAWNFNCTEASKPDEDSMSERLSAFSEWRGERNTDGLATWTLLTKCSQGSVVGLSWLGMACTATAMKTAANSGQSNTGAAALRALSDGKVIHKDRIVMGNEISDILNDVQLSLHKRNDQINSNYTYVAGTNVVSHTALDWKVLAHEIGHSFGAVHDCTEQTCAQGLDQTSQCCPLSSTTCNANGQYIMNPVSAEAQDEFSPCSQGNVCGAIGRDSVNTTCLTLNSGVKLVTTNECGNGIVEEGEDCDCGGEIGCQGNTCCDPKTCKFTTGSQCDDSNDVCCDNCKFASSNTVCRDSLGPCDPAEHCPGDAATCPSDKHSKNGDKCSSEDSSLICISGHCTSRDDQCRSLVGNNSVVTSQGQKLNMTQACPNKFSCVLSCQDPNYGNTCFHLSQYFMDGTPCGYNGYCEKGQCIGGNSPGNSTASDNGYGNAYDSWMNHNKGIIIGVVVGVVGALLLASLLGTLIKNRRQRNQTVQNAIAESRARAASSGAFGYAHPPPPPPPVLMGSGGPPPYPPNSGPSPPSVPGYATWARATPAPPQAGRGYTQYANIPPLPPAQFSHKNSDTEITAYSAPNSVRSSSSGR